MGEGNKSINRFIRVDQAAPVPASARVSPLKRKRDSDSAILNITAANENNENGSFGGWNWLSPPHPKRTNIIYERKSNVFQGGREARDSQEESSSPKFMQNGKLPNSMEHLSVKPPLSASRPLGEYRALRISQLRTGSPVANVGNSPGQVNMKPQRNSPSLAFELSPMVRGVLGPLGPATQRQTAVVSSASMELTGNSAKNFTIRQIAKELKRTAHIAEEAKRNAEEAKVGLMQMQADKKWLLKMQAEQEWLRQNLNPAARAEYERYREAARQASGGSALKPVLTPQTLYGKFAQHIDNDKDGGRQEETPTPPLQIESHSPPITAASQSTDLPDQQRSEEPAELGEQTVPNSIEFTTPSQLKGQEAGKLWKAYLAKIYDPKSESARAAKDLEIELTLKKLEAMQLTRKEAKERAKQDRLRREKDILEEQEALRTRLEEEKEEDEALRPLTEEEEAVVDEALGPGPGSEVLVEHEKSNLEITRATMSCLQPGVWLNDEVINIYLELLKERELRNPKQHSKCHFFNTFFYSKLYSNGSYNYKAVRRWTSQKKLGYTLGDCDKIIVPVHKSIHWTLAVINVRDQQLEYMDSLGGSDGGCLQNLGRYIMDEVKDKSERHLDVSSWEHIQSHNLPEQMNGCDCGVFMVKYADYHARNAPLHFTQRHMNYFRRRMVLEILNLHAS